MLVFEQKATAIPVRKGGVKVANYEAIRKPAVLMSLIIYQDYCFP